MAFNEMLQLIITANGSQAIGEMNRVGTTANTQLGGAQKKAGGFATSFKKNAGMIAVGAVAIGAAIKVSVDAFEEQQLAQLKLENSLKNNPRMAGESAAAFLKQASALQMVTVAADEQVVGAQAMLATFRLTGSEVRSLTPLVVDYARKFDVDLVSAAKQVGKAMDGQVGALKRNGVTIDEVMFKTDRYAAVMGALRGQVGGFAEREGKTLTGQLAIVRNMAGEVAESFGAAVVPALKAVISVGRTVGGVLDDIAKPIGGLGKVIETYYKAIISPAAAAVDVLDSVFASGDKVFKQSGLTPFGGEWVPRVEKATGATKKHADAAGEAAEQLRREQEAAKGVVDSLFGLVDAQLRAESSTLAVESAAKRYEEAVASGGPAALETRQVLNSYQQAVMSASKAAGDAAAQALGPGASAQEKSAAGTKAQIATLMWFAGTLQGPARAAVLQHIADLNALDNKMVSPKINADAGGFWNTTAAVKTRLNAVGQGSATPKIGGIGGGSFTPWAHGGIVTRATASIVGEAGPEAIIPLSNPRRGAEVMRQAGLVGGFGGGGGGGTSVVVNITAPVGADRAAIGREIQELLDAYGLRRGSLN